MGPMSNGNCRLCRQQRSLTRAACPPEHFSSDSSSVYPMQGEPVLQVSLRVAGAGPFFETGSAWNLNYPSANNPSPTLMSAIANRPSLSVSHTSSANSVSGRASCTMEELSFHSVLLRAGEHPNVEAATSASAECWLNWVNWVFLREKW